jgi:hypothetical protein
MEREITLSERQQKHVEQILLAKQSIDRDYQNAVQLLADFDIPEGAPYRYEPGKIVVTLPDEAKEGE